MEARIDQVVSAANTWIVGNDEEVIVVDPGTDAAAVLATVGDRQVLAVICTHGHAGHVGATLAVAERDEAWTALHPADRLSWREVHGKDEPEIEMEDGGEFAVAGLKLEVIHAPGHSAGSVLVYCEKLDVVMCGDVLAADGLVTSEDGFSNFASQISSIGERVLTLPKKTRVLPGHGKELTVATVEKNFDSWYAAGPGAADAG